MKNEAKSSDEGAGRSVRVRHVLLVDVVLVVALLVGAVKLMYRMDSWMDLGFVDETG